MLLPRSKELQENYDTVHVLLDSQNKNKQSSTIQSLFDKQNHFITDMSVPSHLYDDLQMDDWVQSYATTKGGKEYIRRIFHSPITDIQRLQMRANYQNITLSHKRINQLFQELKQDEHNVLWVSSLPPMKDAWPMSLLFPTWPVLKWINHISIALISFHIYRAYISPWLNILYPATTILGPWFYIRKQMDWKMPLFTYLNMLKMFLKVALKPSGNYYQDISKYLTLIVYLLLFVYGTVQSFDSSFMMQKTLTDLNQKMVSIQRFVKNATELRNILATNPWKSVTITQNQRINELPNTQMSTFYQLWSSKERLQEIKDILIDVYAQDAWFSIQKMKNSPGWSIPQFKIDQPTRIWNMGHPKLVQSIKNATRNPIDLTRSLIITGPNAGGKTTYMKTMCINQLLAQSFGITCSQKAIIQPVHAIGSFLRVQDMVGTSSLFEAEVQRCAQLLTLAKQIHNSNHRMLILLDEPMHSTPPIEGASTAMAVIEKLASYPTITVMCTTHYHHMTKLAITNPQFHNISMDCQKQSNGTFIFPYCIRKGPSFECIALELLPVKEIEKDVVARAIEIKNKICSIAIE